MLVAHYKMDMAGIEMRRSSELFQNRKLCASFIDPILLPPLAGTFIGRARTHVKTKPAILPVRTRLRMPGNKKHSRKIASNSDCGT